jgi:hypothetical protein
MNAHRPPIQRTERDAGDLCEAEIIRLDAVAPRVILIAETNVPHEENVSCFGNGSDEAQMVYQFPLPCPGQVRDLITGITFPVNGSGDLGLSVAPYQVLWLAAEAM